MPTALRGHGRGENMPTQGRGHGTQFVHTRVLVRAAEQYPILMTDLLRQEIATAAHTLVVKVGTRILTGADGLLNQERVASLAEELHQVIAAGRRVALVSSGAVGAGMGRLAIKRRPTDLAQLQAVAAVGQSALVEAYDRNLRLHGHHAAQVLLIADDLDNRTRYLNIRNTLLKLLELGTVPIINENDTVSVEELQTTFGDNDRLAAMVTNLIRAPLLVLLSDVEGLYDGDPADANSKIIPTVTRLDESVWALVRDQATGLSKGGMASKLKAAGIAVTAGENVVIASGKTPGTLARILAGEPIGTLFVAQGESFSSRKRWLGLTAQPRGRLTVDDGARPRDRAPRPELAGDRHCRCERKVSQRGCGRARRRPRRRIRTWTIELRGRRNRSHQRLEDRPNRRRSRPLPA